MFSSLDPCGAYHTARIKPGSRVCTVFISPFGTFQYIPMPFGLANTGSVYSGMLDVAMKEVDIIPWASYLGHHTLGSLRTFDTGRLGTCCSWNQNKSLLKPSCSSLRLSTWGKGGVSMIPKYVQEIKNWPVPKTGKEVATPGIL